MDEKLHVIMENPEKYIKSVVGEKYEIECGYKLFLKIISFTFFSINHDFVDRIKKNDCTKESASAGVKVMTKTLMKGFKRVLMDK